MSMNFFNSRWQYFLSDEKIVEIQANQSMFN